MMHFFDDSELAKLDAYSRRAAELDPYVLAMAVFSAGGKPAADAMLRIGQCAGALTKEQLTAVEAGALGRRWAKRGR